MQDISKRDLFTVHQFHDIKINNKEDTSNTQGNGNEQ